MLVKSDSFLIISLSTLNVANYTRGCDYSCYRNCDVRAGQRTFYYQIKFISPEIFSWASLWQPSELSQE